MKIEYGMKYTIEKFLKENNNKYFLHKPFDGTGTHIKKSFGPFGLFSEKVGRVLTGGIFAGGPKEIVCYENELFDLLKDIDLPNDVTLCRE